MAGSDLESRFAYLLKPIRDLAKNWEIDIASQLEDYLDQIDQITITFDNGATSMNFAEAALVIQGSACVYSKKVEYLYTMVYQVLDLLASKKKLQQAGAAGEGDDADPRQMQDQEEEFLTLDDIREHNNIDMKDNGKSGVCDIPQTPMALSKLDETEKGDNPLISTNGEVLANRYDFKMNLGHMHTSALMLLDMSHLSLLEASLFEKPSSTPFRPLPKSRLADEPPPNHQTEDDSGHVDEGLPADISMDDDAAPDLDLPPMSPPHLEETNKRQLRERKNHVITAAPKVVVDPWKIMDPHDPLMTVADKPFRKAKTFKVPTTLESDSTKKRKRKKDPNCGKLEPISEFSTKAYYSASSKFPKNPLKIPFSEFEPLYWKELQRRQQKLRTVRKQLAEQGRLQELAEVEQADQEDDDQGAGFDLPPADDDDEGDFQAPDIQMPDIPEMNFPGGDGPPFSDKSVLGSAPVVNSYEELVRQHVEGFMACAQQYAQVTDLSRRVAEWEQKIIPKLEEEDKHDPFDIHKYGTAVIDKIPETARTKKETVPFREVVQGKPGFEVCRLFLATLQLANNYNLEISVTGELDQAVDTMALKFLSTKRHHEDLQEYRAPSLH